MQINVDMPEHLQKLLLHVISENHQYACDVQANSGRTSLRITWYTGNTGRKRKGNRKVGRGVTAAATMAPILPTATARPRRRITPSTRNRSRRRWEEHKKRQQSAADPDQDTTSRPRLSSAGVTETESPPTPTSLPQEQSAADREHSETAAMETESMPTASSPPPQQPVETTQAPTPTPTKQQPTEPKQPENPTTAATETPEEVADFLNLSETTPDPRRTAPADADTDTIRKTPATSDTAKTKKQRKKNKNKKNKKQTTPAPAEKHPPTTADAYKKSPTPANIEPEPSPIKVMPENTTHRAAASENSNDTDTDSWDPSIADTDIYHQETEIDQELPIELFLYDDDTTYPWPYIWTTTNISADYQNYLFQPPLIGERATLEAIVHRDKIYKSKLSFDFLEREDHQDWTHITDTDITKRELTKLREILTQCALNKIRELPSYEDTTIIDTDIEDILTLKQHDQKDQQRNNTEETHLEQKTHTEEARENSSKSTNKIPGKNQQHPEDILIKKLQDDRSTNQPRTTYILIRPAKEECFTGYLHRNTQQNPVFHSTRMEYGERYHKRRNYIKEQMNKVYMDVTNNALHKKVYQKLLEQCQEYETQHHTGEKKKTDTSTIQFAPPSAPAKRPALLPTPTPTPTSIFIQQQKQMEEEIAAHTTLINEKLTQLEKESQQRINQMLEHAWDNNKTT